MIYDLVKKDYLTKWEKLENKSGEVISKIWLKLVEKWMKDKSRAFCLALLQKLNTNSI